MFVKLVLAGIGATALMDIWGIVRTRWLGTPAADYALIGRWFAHLRRGTFRHASIRAAAPVRHERLIGWVAHYSTGIVFAAVLWLAAGNAWFSAPTLAPALLVGLVTVLAPFLIMQPGMGAGIAASRTPRPNAARVQSVVTHLVFGLGLYAAARVVAVIS